MDGRRFGSGRHGRRGVLDELLAEVEAVKVADLRRVDGPERALADLVLATGDLEEAAREGEVVSDRVLVKEERERNVRTKELRMDQSEIRTCHPFWLSLKYGHRAVIQS